MQAGASIYVPVSLRDARFRAMRKHWHAGRRKCRRWQAANNESVQDSAPYPPLYVDTLFEECPDERNIVGDGRGQVDVSRQGGASVRLVPGVAWRGRWPNRPRTLMDSCLPLQASGSLKLC